MGLEVLSSWELLNPKQCEQVSAYFKNIDKEILSIESRLPYFKIFLF